MPSSVARPMSSSEARPVSGGFRHAGIAVEIAQLLHDYARVDLGRERESIYAIPQPDRLKLLYTAQMAMHATSADKRDIAFWVAAQRLYDLENAALGRDMASIWDADARTQSRFHQQAVCACVAFLSSLEGSRVVPQQAPIAPERMQ